MLDPYEQHYYNDKHQCPDVLKYRQEYLERQFALWMREPVWAVLSLADAARKFARKARSYMRLRAYMSGESNEHADLEKMVKTFETHHNAIDFAGKLIDLTR